MDRRLILNMQKACVVLVGGFSETQDCRVFMDKFFGLSDQREGQRLKELASEVYMGD